MKVLIKSLLLSVLFFLSCNKKELTSKSEDLEYNLESIIDSSYTNRYTLVNGGIEQSLIFLDSLKSIVKQKDNITPKELGLLADSVAKSFQNITGRNYQQINDAEYINLDQLEKNKNLAIKAFLESGLKDSLSLDDFKEYVLPYKLTNEILDNWRETLYLFNEKLLQDHPELKDVDSLIKYHRKHTYYSLSSEGNFKDYLSADDNYSWLDLTKEGDCISRCRYTIYHLRAAGIPATFDYLPNWGNRPYAAHAYVGLAHKKKQVSIKLENDNNPLNLVNDLNQVMNPKFLHVFEEGDLPRDLYVQYEKTIPKVYRQTWNYNPEIMKTLLGVSKEEIFPGLIKANMKDITSQYVDAVDVHVNKSFFQGSKLSYLSVFDISGWTPVAFSPFNWLGKAFFKDIGKNIVYLPMVFNEELIPIGNPFLIDNSGIKKEFVCDKENLIDIKIIRKFPLFSYTANHTIGFKGSYIEGMNSLEKDAPTKILYNINYYPFGMQEINLVNKDSVRYIQFKAPPNGSIRIAEIECYQDSLGILKKVEDVNYKQGFKLKRLGNPYDGDQTTHRSYKTLRMGFGSSKPISKIRFCARSDANYIIPGNEYELFYWDNGWVSKGVLVAKYDYLNYEDVPSGTIYWVRCLTEGKEERIFSYENGRQVWW
ncbi:hypothetical protein NO995_07605 [Aestuariibaculum sp. M13]|uniref:hypothetical protein n=1 Tax=Aestuariibaculum sp. M13 TaxID=2967132 RepID=UPI002159F0CD|nr:hypothetical protein [Aestuariibaculum sp. M13]MCR8667541.1 hypothetical protein [Aestuariibaculum sp. M13]